MKQYPWWLSCVWACGAISGCQGDPPALTQIVLVVDSDLQVPDELDSVTVSVTGAVNMPYAEAKLEEPEMPLTLGLVHTQGPLGPVGVSVQGWRAGAKVVSREADVRFIAEQTLMLPMALKHDCTDLASTCPAGQTCADGDCRPRELDTLPTFASDQWPAAAGAGSGAASSDAGTAALGNLPPVCTIEEPADGSTFTFGTAVRFEGSCRDPEGGRVTSWRWHSSRNGLLSILDHAITARLTTGEHTVTFCGDDPDDSDSNGCATIKLTIESRLSLP